MMIKTIIELFKEFSESVSIGDRNNNNNYYYYSLLL